MQPQDREDAYRLAPVQQGMVFHSLQAPRSGVYLQQLICELREDLDVVALERAWQWLVARHAVLRTSFCLDAAEEASQIIHRQVHLPLARHDWRGMSPRRRTAELEAYLREDRLRGFEPTEAPLVRLALFRFGEANYRLVWTSHHALLDGRARLVLLRELFACYEAYLQGRELHLPLPRPFRDYIEWLEQQDLARAEEYWRHTLAGFAAPTPLVESRTPTALDKAAARQNLRLSRHLTTSLQSLAARHDLTLNTLLQGAWALLLSRCTGEEDVVFGATRACRRSALEGVESMVGLLINTVPVRVRVPPDARLVPWLGELRASWVAMREYEHTPLSVIQRCSDLPGGEPLFETLLVFESRPLDFTLRAEGGGWRNRGFRLRGSTNYPLTVTGHQEPRLRVEITYDPGRFAGDAIARMLQHLRTLLEGMVTRPGARLGELPFLTAEERRRVLVDFNRTPRVSAEPACLHRIVEAQADRTPGATAVVSGTARLTYDQLDRRANRLAHHLRALGVGPEVRVCLCVERSLDLVVSLLGILKAGGAYVPLDPGYPEARLRFMVEDAGARVIVSRRRLLETLTGSVAGTVVCLELDREAIAARSAERPTGGATPDDQAYVLYTSGSTGRPKGVAIAHRSAAALLDWAHQVYSPDELAGVLAASSMSFDLSVFELFVPLAHGGAVILAENILELPRLPAAGRVTLVNTVPSAMATVLRTGGLPASVRTVNLAGETLHQSLVRELHEDQSSRRLYNLYGPTEDTTYSTYALVTPETAEPPPIGRPISDTRCYVLDRRLDPLSPGVPGELYISGPGLARGYVGRPGLTAECFVPDPFSDVPGTRMYRTGDRVRWRSDGALEFLGRVDHQVKIRGHRVEPGEVAAVLRSHPAVQDCAVVARGEGTQATLAAYVVPAARSEPTATDLRGFLKQHLPAFLLPATFVELDALPLTPNGKLDRGSLPVPSQSVADPTTGFTAPRTPAEQLLAGIWAEVLKLERVGVHDDFFELGGHSLVATQIASRVRDTFRVEISMGALFEARTVAELAALVGRAKPTVDSGASTVGRRDVPGRGFPLSFAQERLWFLDQLEPGSPFYNTPIALRLRGTLDRAALGHALAAVVARHDVLRTTFPAAGGEPGAVVAPSVEISLPLIDLIGRPWPDREAEARRLATEEARRPFNLTRGPLLRARLYRFDRHEHLLVLVMHHIVTDGWSAGVLFSELGAIYRAFTAGASPALRPVPMQYGEYAAWQREWLRDDVLASQLGYWKARLEGAPAVLDLPTDWPRPARQGFLGARLSRELPASLLTEVGALSQRQGATLFMALLAAFQTLLFRYTNREDLVLAVPIANRQRMEAENMIGLFVNTLALRTDLSGNPRFRDLLARVRQSMLEAYVHQDLPFQRLVEELAPGRDPSRAPLVQVMFQQVRLPTLDLPGVTAHPVDIDRGAAKFDLTLSILELESGARACLEYDTALFDDATIGRMLGHYVILLESIVANPTRRLSELPLLGQEERTRLLGPRQDATPGRAPDRCIHHLFEAQVELTPDATAVVFESRELSYRELNAEANRVAHALRGRGVGPEVRVGICCTRSPEMIVGLLGVLKAGGTYVPLDPASPRERLTLILEEAKPLVVLTQAALAADLDGLPAAVLRLDADREILAAESEANPGSVVWPACGAYVIYTSGSTGRPKGVVVEHRTVMNYVWGIGRRLDLPRGAAFAMVQPLTVDSSVTVLFPSLCAGGCLHLVSEERAADAAALSGYFHRNSIDCLKIAPSHLAALQSALNPGRLLPRRCLVLGGEASQWRWVRELESLAPDCRILNHYGPTEATVGVLTYLVGSEGDEGRSPLVPMGRPLPGIQAYVLDPHLNPVPLGIPGELHLAGDCLARGYLNRPGVTAEKFIPNPFDPTPGARMYRTGDLARYRPDGELEFLGRRDDQVKIRGYRIEPKEIEAALRMHPAVREAAVVPREPDGPDSRILVAYLSCRQPAPPSRELAGFLREKLPEYMIPAVFSILDALPRTPQGKLDRKALPDPGRSRPTSDGVSTTARTPVEDLLAGIWAEVLRVDIVGLDENFFELGGHSLSATRVISRVRTVLGVEVPVRALFEAPTVARLAARIESLLRIAPPSPPITPAPRPERLPLSHLQQRLWSIHQMNPESPVHNSQLLVRLTGPLDVEALRRALESVVARHEALRTTFPVVDGTPVQRVADPGAIPLPLADVSGLPVAERAREADRLLLEEAKRPFDLASGPLLRARVVRLHPAQHLLLLSINHIVTDGSSASILLNELSTLYEACMAGRPSPLPPLAIQYPDFALWQREWRRGDRLELPLEYWRRRLAGAAPALELPTDRPRPPVVSHRGARVSLTLSRALSDGLAALNRREGVTLFMTVTAAFQALLARYSGKEDIVVGAPAAGRGRQETEGLIGLFLNMLVLRTDLSGDPTFTTLLVRVRDVALGAYTHQDVPFERLIEALAPERDPSRHPIFQVLVNRLPPPPSRIERAGLTFERLTPPSLGSWYDLTLYVRDLPGGVELHMAYSTDLFEAATIVRMLEDLRVLLEGAVADPTRRLSQLPLPPKVQRQRPGEGSQVDTETEPQVTLGAAALTGELRG